MVLIDRFKALSTKKKVILSSVTAAVVIGIVVACILLSRGYYAKTMRLLRIEGTVNIEDADGNEVAYYEYAYEYQDYSDVPNPDEPNYPNASVPGYSYTDFVYGDEFKGHPTYIVVEEYSADGSSGVTTYYAYYPSEWVPLTVRLSSDGTVTQYVLPDGVIYYETPAN